MKVPLCLSLANAANAGNDTGGSACCVAGVEPGRIIDQYIDHLYHIRRAIVPSMPNRHIWLDDETLAFYDGLVERHGQARSTRRVYVTRRSWKPAGGSGSRVMTNEAELIEELERRGFEIVEPESFSAVEQIRLFLRPL